MIYFPTIWGAKEPQNLPNHRVDGISTTISSTGERWISEPCNSVIYIIIHAYVLANYRDRLCIAGWSPLYMVVNFGSGLGSVPKMF